MPLCESLEGALQVLRVVGASQSDDAAIADEIISLAE